MANEIWVTLLMCTDSVSVSCLYAFGQLAFLSVFISYSKCSVSPLLGDDDT